MNRLRVNIMNADSQACGAYRLIFPGECLADDPNVDIRFGDRLQCVREAGPLGDFPVKVDTDADVIVLQRPLRRELVEVIPVLQRHGVAVCVEIDDLFHGLPIGHPGRKAWAPMADPNRNWRWLRKACELADLVTCTTQLLADEYAPHGRVMVLPNCVPAWYLDVEPERGEQTTIVWPGTALTHTGDLDVMGDAVARVQAETGCTFLALGGSDTLERLGVTGEFVPWCPLESRGPEGYARQVARGHIGIAPLADNIFNGAKSYLKPIEYAALGVAYVASPRADYRKLYDTHGIGLLADTPEWWFRRLLALVTDGEWREEIAAENRERMRALTYEGNAWRWAESFLLAYANRMKARAA